MKAESQKSEQHVRAGQASARARLGGLSPEQVSDAMRQVASQGAGRPTFAASIRRNTSRRHTKQV